MIVVATYDRKDNGSLKDPVVSLGSLKDMNVAKDKNGNIIDDYNTVVYVANTSDSGRIADLVYIVKTEKVSMTIPSPSRTMPAAPTLWPSRAPTLRITATAPWASMTTRH